MTLPENWDLIPVRGHYIDSQGDPIQGRVIFTPKAGRLVSPDTLTTIIGTPVSTTLDTDGKFEIYLAATDDPDKLPLDFTYSVREDFSGGSSYSIEVPLSSKDSGIDLAVVAPVTPNSGDATTPVTRLEFEATNSNVSRLQQTLTTADPLANDSTRLRSFRLALANAASEPCDIFVLGDSVSEGYGASSIATRWENLLVDRLRDYAGVPDGGEGYVPSWYEDSTKADRFVGGTFVTRSDLFGLGLRTMVLSGGTTSFTFTGTGCDVMIALGHAGGKFTWNLDGGTETGQIGTYAATDQGGWVLISPRDLEHGEHTINITKAVGDLYIEGAMVYDGDEDHGVRLIEGAHSGIKAMAYANNTWWANSISPKGYPYSLPTAAVSGRGDPALLIVLIGLNDLNGRTAAEFKADLKTDIDLARADTTIEPSVLLMVPWERNTSTITPVSTWDEYRQVYYEVAEEDGRIALLDLKDTIKSLADDTYGLGQSDGIHPNDKGYAAIAQEVFRVLTSA